MESDEFSYIKNCEMLNPEALHALRSLVAQYPYYQTARLLLVKNMCNNKNPELGYELQKASLFAADRSVLFYMTEGDKYRLDYAFQHGGDKKADVAVASKKKGMDRTSDLINDFLVAMPDDQPHRRLTLADATTDYAAYLEQQDEEDSPKGKYQSPAFSVKTTVKGNAQPLTQKSDLPMTGEKDSADDESERTAAVNESVESQFNSQENGGDENFFTETLAKIYIKQGKYLRAIEIMRRLEADYPKKSSYFADQIRFLEKIVINNKNKK